MTESADSVGYGTLVAIQLTAAGILTHLHPIQIKVPYIVGMRPHTVFTTASGLTMACIHYKHLFHGAVLVPVVSREIHIGIHHATCFFHHIFGTLVVAVYVVCAIVGAIVAHGHGSHHVKGEIEESVALVQEVAVRAGVYIVLGSPFAIE